MRLSDRVHRAQLLAMRVADVKASFAEPPPPRVFMDKDELERLRDSRNGWLIPEAEASVDDLHSLPHPGFANLNNHGCRVAVYGGDWE
jgi:hypothetical protein